MLVGATLIDMLGAGGGDDGGNKLAPVLLKEQAKKDEASAQRTASAVHQASSLEREVRFDTCMARAALFCNPLEPRSPSMDLARSPGA
jgi:hypothetical protein